MYFESRSQAGRVLATELVERYRYENTIVVALSVGGVPVGLSVATALHCMLTLLVSENIEVPGEGVSFGSVSQEGDFTYNSAFSAGEIDGYTSEFHGYLSEQQRMAFSKLNQLIGDGGTISREMLRDRVIILVSDGFSDGSTLGVALDFLKPVRYVKLIVAAPVASVQAVDKLHVEADELHILDVKENYMSTDHYFEQNDVPSMEDAVKEINQAILNWK
ncbi:MAG: phosphoribosyltransferase family protein [Candidatus Saccharimonas sp.]